MAIKSHDSHGEGDHVTGHAVPGNIARDGKGKHVSAVAVHDGMTRRQTSFNAMGHANATALDANPASPLTKEPAGKTLAPVQATPGMRSRTSPHDPALGQAILEAAGFGRCK
jgi:hypothetical protein